MKKLLSFTLIATLLLALISAPSIAEVQELSVVLNGEILEFDVPPQIINDRTMVPMRIIFEAMGKGIQWIGAEHHEEINITFPAAAVAYNDYMEFAFIIGDDYAYRWDRGTGENLEQIPLDSPAVIIDGRTLVPVRAVAEGFGADVGWDPYTRTVIINTDTTPHL